MKKLITLILSMLLPLAAFSGDFTALGGVARFNQPHDGIYWNHNQPHDHRMITPAFGLRYDTGRFWSDYSFGVQYTNFGTVTMNSLAVTRDAPYEGGYIPGAGTCVGTCQPLARWKMQTATQSVAFVGTRHWGRLSAEIGANVFETRTSGGVDFTDGTTYRYSNTNFVDVGPMAGVAYRRGPWSVRAQLWRMEGRTVPGQKDSAPPAYKENFQATLMVGYTF